MMRLYKRLVHGNLIIFSMISLMVTGCAGNDASPQVIDNGGVQVPTTACTLSVEQRQLLDGTNQIRRTGSMCGGVSFPAVAEVSWDCRIASAAQGHSDDMASVGFLSHTGSNGFELINRLNSESYIPQAWSENIAQGQITVNEVLEGWMDSTGHCENIMSNAYENMGAAVSTSDDGTRYWTQDFATLL